MVWSDEFNGTVGSAPNPANWGYDTGASGWGNNELENYTTSTANSQIVADGNATDGRSLAVIVLDPGGNNGAVGSYTSARLNSSSKQSFQYGYMEARIQSPTGGGLWPAWWMLGTNIGSVGWPACGEIDIMEQICNAGYQGTNYGSLHSPNYNSPSPANIYTTTTPPLFNAAYHTYAALWQQGQVQFYVDNNLYETTTAAQVTAAGGTWAFDHPFFFLINCAVGGNFPGPPSPSLSFPQTLLVDYVRVYQNTGPTFTPTNTPTPVVASTWRVNAGGPVYTDGAGNLWVADTNFSGGTGAPSGGAIAGTTDPTLYDTQRYGNNFTYSFNVPPGSYQVTLKFAETYSGDFAVGARVFNVAINGGQVLSNLDIFKEVGANTADDKVFNNVSPSGGLITIQFTGTASTDTNAVVEALQILPMPPTPTFTPTVTRTFTFTSTRTFTNTNTPIPPTSTPTATRSFTPTFTSTFTMTFTPTRTNTPMATATSTYTLTRTSTSTSTSTWTSTNTLSATPTNSSTDSPTRTNTPTSTGTSTYTNTGTTSPTTTSTSTGTFTNTPSNTSTATSASTATPTRSSTSTFTSTATNSSTFSSTRTSTSTNTSTMTPNSTATSTATGTETFTKTYTGTPSFTSANTLINTPTMTPTSTNTSTHSFTATNTGSFTATASSTPTAIFTSTRTFTSTSTSTFTATSTSTPMGTSTSTATATSTASFTVTPSFTTTPSNTPTSSSTSTTVPVKTPVVYPNPWDGDGGKPLKLRVTLSAPGEVKVKLFTTAFRKVWEGDFPYEPAGTDDLTLSLPQVAYGVYYLVVELNGKRWILKLLVLG